MAIYQVENVPIMAQWARDIMAGQVKIGDLPGEHHDSFSSTVGRENGKFKDNIGEVWIMYWTNSVQGRVAIRGLSAEEYEELQNDFTKRKQYEKELPEGFHDESQYWPVGTWHRQCQ